MLFMPVIIDLMLPWRLSIPAEKNVALISKKSPDADVKIEAVREVSGGTNDMIRQQQVSDYNKSETSQYEADLFSEFLHLSI